MSDLNSSVGRDCGSQRYKPEKSGVKIGALQITKEKHTNMSKQLIPAAGCPSGGNDDCAGAWHQGRRRTGGRAKS